MTRFKGIATFCNFHFFAPFFSVATMTRFKGIATPLINGDYIAYLHVRVATMTRFKGIATQLFFQIFFHFLIQLPLGCNDDPI